MSRRRYRIEYLPLAERDLLDIVDYIARDRPHAARSFVDRLDRVVARLAIFPRSGKYPNDDRLRRSGYRIVLVEDYLVFYVLVGSVVQIRQVIHGSRRCEFLLPN